MTKPFYAVVSFGTVRRVTQRPPHLEPGEVVLRLVLEVPDELVKRPTYVLEVPEDASSILAVAPAPLEVEEVPS